jgi:hypothetical protein
VLRIANARQRGTTRKQEQHEMKKEGHKWDMLLAQARIDHQQTFMPNQQTTSSAS